MWTVIRETRNYAIKELYKLERFAKKMAEDINESPSIMRDLLREKRFDLSRSKQFLTQTIQIEEYSGIIYVNYKSNGTLKKAFRLSKQKSS